MAVYSTISTIKNQMQESDARFWTVYDSAGNCIAESNDLKAKDQTVETSFDKLKSVLDECTGDYVKVTIRTKLANKDEDGNYKAGATKGQKIYQYFIACTPVGNQSINGNSDRAMLEQIYELRQQLKDKDNEIRFSEMQKKIEGLTAQKNDNGIMDKFVAKVLDNIADKLTGNEIKKILSKDDGPLAEPVAERVGEEPGEVESDKTKIVVVEFLKATGRVMGSEEKTLAAIAALTKLAKDKPGTFKETADQLIAMSNV